MGAPVCTRTACRGCRRVGVRSPTRTVPTTGSSTVPISPADSSISSSSSGLPPSPGLITRTTPPAACTSTLRTAYPSMAAWSNPGNGRAVTTSSAHNKPWASAIATRTGRGATAAAVTLACCSSTERTGAFLTPTPAARTIPGRAARPATPASPDRNRRDPMQSQQQP
ncbi:Uncharacterised protein [Mycobacteroides abscessus subsp. abscessus]|nr:Uncharacterised protein [Mycobacteroides abscessus subsp. abscessus]